VSPSSYDSAHWLMAAVDPVLVAVALVLGWKASQFGKVFIAAIAALGLSVLASFAIHAAGLPWPAPITRDLPTFFPVRTIAAVLWASAAFAARRLLGRSSSAVEGAARQDSARE
jgi:hypothetical protein